MGCTPLFCCFKNFRPSCIALTALITNIVAVCFMIWALADLAWKNNSRKALYIIAFILLCLTLAFLIVVFILLNLRKGDNYISINNIGKIFCLIIALLAILAFIFLIIVEIMLIVDYADIEKDAGPGRQIPSHDWAACILPGILGLIASVVVALCANILYTVFNENILGSIFENQNNSPMNVVQNSMVSNPNVTQEPVVVTVNNPPTLPPPIIPNVEPEKPKVQDILPNLNVKAPFQEPYPANFQSLTNLMK